MKYECLSLSITALSKFPNHIWIRVILVYHSLVYLLQQNATLATSLKE